MPAWNSKGTFSRK